ncbi:regulator of G protein signaling domain-containing protein [Zychaea mexicana]|uniref:regulator of G protein signaling domain-containing protein n=1 Tax=Zychaea mexicana TaxID=64656 RepID=UPI0022FDBBAC|nr:regulator of G protein signaling domain-containing protein [Zychaea mexicana]KAI9484721.1 regulator of G protein signaling domain-containing protein [Zychaea mexicana]
MQDLFDLFSALLIQMPLTEHRSFFRTYPGTFTTEEAIKSLADLKFTHVVRTPDPADPSRQISTRTTTTFSMTPTMAKTLGTHVLNARLAEDATNPQNRTMKDKGIWRPTPKAKYMIQQFSKRAHVSVSHMQDSLTRIDTFKIFTFERLNNDDRLAFNRTNMTNCFRTMMAWLPTEKLLADDVGGVKERNLGDFRFSFYGYQCFEWISEYTTAVTPQEAEIAASEFVLYGWIEQILDKADRVNYIKEDSTTSFKMTRSTLYYVTQRGQKVLGWEKVDDQASSVESTSDQSNGDKTELVQKQQKHANRLLATEENVVIMGVPQATINERKQQPQSISKGTAGKELIIESEGSKKYDFGFTKQQLQQQLQKQQHDAASLPDDQSSVKSSEEELDEITQKLLKLRSTGGGSSSIEGRSVRRSETSSSSSSSQDSGLDVGDDSVQSSDNVPISSNNLPKDSQWMRLKQILEEPLLRMYFRNFMKNSYCDENIDFWVEYLALRKLRRDSANQKDVLSASYKIYEKFLGPNAASEVNIDHALRQEITQLVTSTFSVAAGATRDLPFSSGTIQVVTAQRTVVVHGPSGDTLNELIALYDRVNDHVCRIMAQDSVPRFTRTEQYRRLIANRDSNRAD